MDAYIMSVWFGHEGDLIFNIVNADRHDKKIMERILVLSQRFQNIDMEGAEATFAQGAANLHTLVYQERQNYLLNIKVYLGPVESEVIQATTVIFFGCLVRRFPLVPELGCCLIKFSEGFIDILNVEVWDSKTSAS